MRTCSLALADAFRRYATGLSRIPGTVQNLPAPALPLLILFYAWLILIAVRPRLSLRFPGLPLRRAWMLPPFLALIVAYFFCSGPLQPRDTLAFHLLSVGNAQASILELPNAATLACDLGTTDTSNLAEYTVMPFLRTRRLRRIDALLISHPNWDHYSGAADLIHAVDVPTLMVSPYFQDDSARQGLSRLLSSGTRLTVLAGPASLTGTGQARLEILWPPPPGQLPFDLTANDSSLVLRITYAGKRILLTGDISATAQRTLLVNGTDLQADVLIWPHHGALIDTTAAFFQAVNPSIILVSCRPERARQIRTQTPTALLAGREIYTTAENGALTVLLTNDGLKVLPFIRQD